MKTAVLTLGLALGALVGTAAAQGKADDPSTVLQAKSREFAGCVTSKQPERVTLRLMLDGDGVVKKVEIEASARVGKPSRQCLERTARGLRFAGTLAWQTIEHQFAVVNTGLARPARR